MSGTYTVTMGGRGRLVVPAELRQRAGIHEGGTLILVETDSGIILLTREQLKARVRRDLADANMVEQLLTERRANATAEDAA